MHISLQTFITIMFIHPTLHLTLSNIIKFHARKAGS